MTCKLIEGWPTNKLDIRHNNTGKGSIPEYAKNWTKVDFENWYDKIYHTLLMVILSKRQLKIMQEMNKLKEKWFGNSENLHFSIFSKNKYIMARQEKAMKRDEEYRTRLASGVVNAELKVYKALIAAGKITAEDAVQVSGYPKEMFASK